MEAQTIFDTVVNHLRQQGKKAGVQLDTHFSCRYRTDDGLKCAIGCLIPDAEYSSKIEGSGVEAIVPSLNEDENTCVVLSCLLPYRMHMALLDRLQTIHDSSEVSDWEDEFENCSRSFNLHFSKRKEQ